MTLLRRSAGRWDLDQIAPAAQDAGEFQAVRVARCTRGPSLALRMARTHARERRQG
jgi:hypothetical protein